MRKLRGKRTIDVAMVVNKTETETETELYDVCAYCRARRHMSHHVNPAKKEAPHSFKDQQLENKLLYRFVIYMGF